MTLFVRFFCYLCVLEFSPILCQTKIDESSDVVLVLGVAGSGKSTFIQWMAGDNSNLISKETFPDTGEYLIEDTNDKSESPIDFVTDEVTGTTFYEFPAFSNNDNIHEYLNIAPNKSALDRTETPNKSALDRTENLKMLLLTTYNTVQEGMDNTRFPKLLKNFANLIGDVDIFKDSIALVVTKVDSVFIKQGKTFILRPDSAMIKRIAKYLFDLRKVFEEDLAKSDIIDEKRKFNANAIKIINILLTQEDGRFERIILFRRPDEKGSLSEIELLLKGKLFVQQIISENIQFNRIESSVTEINKQITRSVDEIVADIKRKLESFVEPVRVEIEADKGSFNLTDALAFSTQTDNDQTTLFDAVVYFTRLSGIDDVGEALTNYLNELDVKVPESLRENMLLYSKHFEFFQLFYEVPLPISTLSWANSFQSALNYLTESKQFITEKAIDLAEGINSQITSDVDSIAENIKTIFMDEVNRMTEILESLTNNSYTVSVNPLAALSFHDRLANGEKLLTELVESVKVIPKPLMLTNEISEALALMRFELPIDVLANIRERSKKFEILEGLSDTNFSIPSAQWSNSFKEITAYIQTQSISTFIKDTQKVIASDVDALLKTVTEKVRSVFDTKSLELEADKLVDEFKRWHQLLNIISENFTENSTLKKLTDDVALKLEELSVNEKTILANLRSLKEKETYLGFLESLKGNDIDVFLTPVWKGYIIDLAEYFETHLNFNSFVLSLFERLSQYDVQSNVSRYDVSDLADWGEPGHSQGIHVDENNFELFMEKIQDFNIEDAKKIRNIVPSDSQISVLNNILQVTLQKRVFTHCPTAPNTTVILRANFIKFSDFLDSSGKFKGCGWGKVSSLEIYALATLFIDKDMDALGTKLAVSIVAPNWEVIGFRKIILDGKSGEFLPKAADGLRAADGRGDGQNGLPGHAGESAGAFFGVVSTFIGSENLTISANGGNGGPGQSGGNGAKGQDGKTPWNSYCGIGEYYSEKFRVYVVKSRSCGWFYSKTCTDYIIYGSDATSGGNAGSCGVGGQGGLAGQSFIISLTEPSREVKFSIDGKTAENGVSGKAGLGGTHGSNRKMSCYYYVTGLEMDTYLINRGSAANGTSSYGCTSLAPENPQPAATVHPLAALKNFIKFFIENSNERFIRFTTLSTYDKIRTNAETQALQDTVGLIEDLKMLESCSQSSNLNLVPFYQSHLTGIENYAANPKEKEKSDDFKKVLSYLYTASLNQISNLRKNQDSDLVVDIYGYLTTVLENVKTLSTLQDESRLFSVVETLKNNFKAENNKKIAEALRLIEIALFPELESLGSQFEYQILGLVQEVIALQNAAKQEKTVLETKKKKLENSLSNGIFGGVLKVFTTVCRFFGPIGMVVGEVIEVEIFVVSSLEQGEAQNLPTFKAGGLTTKLKGFGSSLLDLSKLITTNQNNIFEVTKGINDIEQVIEKLRIFEKRVYERMIPMIEQMGNDLIKTASDLQSKSSTSLDVVGWQVQETLRDISLEIHQFTRGFEVHESIARSIEKLEAVLTTLIKVYNRIQDYQDQQRLVVYMANLASASVKQVVVSNPTLSNSLRDLQISIQSNILINEYNSVLKAFKQWIFPFAEVFLKDFELPVTAAAGNEDMEALASNVASRIKQVRSRIQKYKTTIQDFDKNIYLALFTSNTAATNPFYIWKNEENRDMITRLLAGEAVVVEANVMNSVPGKDAVKFNFIELGFKSNDPDVQAQINKNLLNFGINMTHLGNSHYRYNGQYFSIASSSQSMHYSFKKSENGKAVYGNNVYYKLISGDIMLSPYTMWELKLTLNQSNATNLNVSSFVSLSNFSDKVDLVLEGRGSFVYKGATNLNVESYYQLDDSIKLTEG